MGILTSEQVEYAFRRKIAHGVGDGNPWLLSYIDTEHGETIHVMKKKTFVTYYLHLLIIELAAMALTKSLSIKQRSFFEAVLSAQPLYEKDPNGDET